MLEQYSDVITLDEVCEALMIEKNSLYNYLRKGELKSFRCGKHFKVPKKAVIQFIKEKNRL